MYVESKNVPHTPIIPWRRYRSGPQWDSALTLHKFSPLLKLCIRLCESAYCVSRRLVPTQYTGVIQYLELRNSPAYSMSKNSLVGTM